MKKILKILIIVLITTTLCTSCASLFFGAAADAKSNKSTR